MVTRGSGTDTGAGAGGDAGGGTDANASSAVAPSDAPPLLRDADGLYLESGGMRLRADFSHLLPRLSPHALNRELLVRAARMRDVEHPHAVDATAGLGDDALLLAAAGFTVTLFERNPTIAALLADALERAARTGELADVVGRMRLIEGDSVRGMAQLDERPHVVLLDPMFPERRKGAASRKKAQLLQGLEVPCEDEAALLGAAIDAGPRKVVVKRPLKGPRLAGMRPSYVLRGTTIRYDCLVLPENTSSARVTSRGRTHTGAK